MVPELSGAEAVVVGGSEALVVGVTASTKVPCNQASCSGVNGTGGHTHSDKLLERLSQTEKLTRSCVHRNSQNPAFTETGY